MGIGGQVPGGSQLPQHLPETGEMRIRRLHDVHVRQLQPGLETRHDLVDRQGPRDDLAVGGDADEPRHRRPGEADPLGTGKAVVPPLPGGGVHLSRRYARERERRRRAGSCGTLAEVAKRSASSSSASWPSLSRSMPGRKPNECGMVCGTAPRRALRVSPRPARIVRLTTSLSRHRPLRLGSWHLATGCVSPAGARAPAKIQRRFAGARTLMARRLPRAAFGVDGIPLAPPSTSAATSVCSSHSSYRSGVHPPSMTSMR